MSEPVVYFKPGCPFGIRLRTALTLHRVPHRSVRFRDDEDGAARVRDVNDGNEIHRRSTSPAGGSPIPAGARFGTRRAMTSQLRWWSAAVAVAAISMLLVGCGDRGLRDPDDGSAPDERASTSATSEAPTSEAPARVARWKAAGGPAPISLEETEATVRRHGLGRWVEDYRANAPFSGDTVLTLTIEDGAWDLYGESGGGQPEPIDYDAEYEIDGDTVVFHHSDGSNTYRWQVDHDTLTTPLRPVDAARLPGDPGRGVPACALHDRDVHEAGLTWSEDTIDRDPVA